MLENSFFIYANYSLREDPTNFYRIFDEVGYDFLGSYKHVIDLVGHVAVISEANLTIKNEGQLNNKFLLWRRIIESFSPVDSGDITTNQIAWFDSAFEAVYGYADAKGSCGYCERECPHRVRRKSVLDEGNFVGPDRIKCHECHQLFFRNILERITLGEQYSNITGFDELLLHASIAVRRNFNITPRDTSGATADRLTESLELVPHGYFDDKSDQRDRFYELVYGIFGYSLVDYLLKNDRQLLKHCPYCNNFFIAKRRNRKSRCYDKACERAYQREKKRKQRTKEPEIYC